MSRTRLALGAALLLAACDDPSPYAHPKDATLRLNQIQLLATHNSYHVRDEPTDFVEWQYEMAPLTTQLEDQGVRGIELDVHWNPDVGHFEVFHMNLLDEGTTCRVFTDCLTEVRDFSDSHPGHHPIFVQLEMKSPNDTTGHVTPEVMHYLDDEILSVFPEHRIVMPSQVQGSHATLQEAVTTDGWPTLAKSRGRVLFSFDCQRSQCLAYAGEGTDMRGRTIFPASEDGDPFAAFYVHNSVDAEATALVQQGYLVRVFGDSYEEAVDGTADFGAALATGAQVVSTDVPAPIEATSYYASIPGGTPSRCNPVNAPADCVPTDVEDPALLHRR